VVFITEHRTDANGLAVPLSGGGYGTPPSPLKDSGRPWVPLEILFWARIISPPAPPGGWEPKAFAVLTGTG
jgi:hypothetical protein